MKNRGYMLFVGLLVGMSSVGCMRATETNKALRLPENRDLLIVSFDEKKCPLSVVKMYDNCPTGLGTDDTSCRWPEDTAFEPTIISWRSLSPHEGQVPKYKIEFSTSATTPFPCTTEIAGHLMMAKQMHHCNIKKTRDIPMPVDNSNLKIKYSVIAGDVSCVDDPETKNDERVLDPYLILMH